MVKLLQIDSLGIGQTVNAVKEIGIVETGILIVLLMGAYALKKYFDKK